MVVLFKGEVLRGGQRHAGRRDALDGRVVREVYEQDRAVDGAGLPKALDEEVRFLEGDAERGEYDDERVVRAAHLGLPGDLRRKLGVRQARGREDRQLLPAHERVQAVDGRNTGLNEFLRVTARGRVHRQAVDVVAPLGQNFRPAVDRAAEAVENAAEHVLAHAEFHRAAEEADAAVREVDARGALKELHERVALVDLEHLAAALSPFASSISASSSYVTFSTPLTSISGPATSCIVLYSFGIRSPPYSVRRR